MSTAADILNAIRGYLGVSENPPHSNQTVIGEKFGWNGVPWCAETVSVCAQEAGLPFNGSASCIVLVHRYQSGENGTWLGNPGAVGIAPGDEFFLGRGGGDHTGLVELVDGDTVHSIEGNWGDRVCRVSRPVSVFFGFGRPNYTAPAEDDLNDDQNRWLQETDLRVAEIDDKVKHIEAMLGSAIDVLNALKAKFGA